MTCNQKTIFMHPLFQFNYCPKCGSSSFVEHNFKSKICNDCGFIYYFNCSASTAAFIMDSAGRLMAVRRANDPAKGTLDLPGGFVDPDETAEEAVKREVKEETGLEISRLRYMFSIPNRYLYSGFEVHTVDLFFECQVDDVSMAKANDDASEIIFLQPNEINPEDFGLDSIRKSIIKFQERETKTK